MVFGGFGGGGTNRVKVHIVGDKTDLDKKLRASEKEVKTSGSRMTQSLRANAAKIRIGVTVAAVAMGAIAKVAIDRAERMNSAYAITEQVIKQTGGAANVTAEELKEMARQSSILTGFDKALVTESQNVLLTFKNLRNELGEGNDVFDRTAALVLDISATMGTDAKSGALQLGKALNDPISQMGALSRAGLTFSKSQQDMIKDLARSGNLLEAQTIILGELESQLGGTAKAAADDSDKIARSFDEITESIGMGLLPVLASLARDIPVLFGQISELQRLSGVTGFEVGSVELADKAITDLSESTRFFGSILRALPFGPSGSFAEGIRAIMEESELTNEELDQLIDNVARLREEGKLTGAQAETLTGILNDQKKSAAQLRAEARRLAAQQGRLAGATEETTDAAEELTEAEKEQAEALDEAAEAVKRKRDALLEVHNPLFRITRLTRDLEEAEQAVIEAEDKFTRDSPEFVDAVMERADVLFDLRTTFDELVAEGINPTGEAARNMFRGLGVPDDVIDEIFGVFDTIQANLSDRLFSVDVRAEWLGLTGPIPDPAHPRLTRHTGGRINAPRGQEVLARVLGGEEIRNPAHDQGGNGASTVIDDAPADPPISITVNGFVGDAVQLAVEIERMLTRRSRDLVR
jgi:hypothetical protein